MKIRIKNKLIQIKAKRVSNIGAFIGLMFKTKKTRNLLFEFRKTRRHAIHSFFVFFPFLAVWLDKGNNLLEARIVKPFTSSLKSEKPAAKLIELPLNSDNEEIIKLIVDKERFKY